MAEETMGERVRLLRLRNNMTQRSLAEAAGVAKSHVHQVEHGRRKELRYDTLLRYAHALGVSPEFLHSGEEHEAESQRDVRARDRSRADPSSELSKGSHPADRDTFIVLRATMVQLTPERRKQLMRFADALRREQEIADEQAHDDGQRSSPS